MLAERQPDDAPVQLLISVPKKRFKHAVDRNRVKRQIREAYRLHKTILCDAVPADRQLLLAFIWLSDEHVASAEVENRVVRLMQRIAER
jgi:ribonuclease P protein component